MTSLSCKGFMFSFCLLLKDIINCQCVEFEFRLSLFSVQGAKLEVQVVANKVTTSLSILMPQPAGCGPSTCGPLRAWQMQPCQCAIGTCAVLSTRGRRG